MQEELQPLRPCAKRKVLALHQKISKCMCNCAPKVTLPYFNLLASLNDQLLILFTVANKDSMILKRF